jgi:hypothetical protein
LFEELEGRQPFERRMGSLFVVFSKLGLRDFPEAPQAELAERGIELALSRSWGDIANETFDVYEQALIEY